MVAVSGAAPDQRAYETHVSTGSTAKSSIFAFCTLHFSLFTKWGPHPELHRVGSPTEREHHWKCFEGIENGLPRRSPRRCEQMTAFALRATARQPLRPARLWAKAGRRETTCTSKAA